MPRKIKFKFKDDENTYSCIVTYQQHFNLKSLPPIDFCHIIDENVESIEMKEQEMQRALDLAIKNDTSHVKNLSQIVDN